MLFVKVKDPQEGEQYITKALVRALENNLRVTWLISGGSNIVIACEVRHALPANKLSHLKAALADERYGKLGHSDSNFAKLSQAGFDFSGVDFEPVITKDSLNFEQTTKNYERHLRELFKKSDIIIGQFGIGADGHTAGILPHSPVTAVDDRLIIGYKTADYERISLSFGAIAMVNQAFVFAFGEDKRSTLQLLHDKDQSLSDQPAQIFRQYKGKSFIINNMIGDSA